MVENVEVKQRNPLREEIETRLRVDPREDDIEFYVMWPFQTRILNGETTGDDISDFLFLNMSPRDKDFAEKERWLRSLQDDINSYVGEHILIYEEYRHLTGGCIDSGGSVGWADAQEWFLGRIEAPGLSLERSDGISADIELGKSRWPNIQIATSHYVNKAHWDITRKRLEHLKRKMPIHILPTRRVLVGEEAIEGWIQEDARNRDIYGEIALVLSQDLTAGE